MDMYHAVIFLLEQQATFGDVPTASAAREHLVKMKASHAEVSAIASVLGQGRIGSVPAPTGDSAQLHLGTDVDQTLNPHKI